MEAIANAVATTKEIVTKLESDVEALKGLVSAITSRLSTLTVVIVMESIAIMVLAIILAIV